MKDREDMEQKICRNKIISVLVFEKESEVSPVVEALLENGVNVIELALRSPYAVQAVELVKKKYPQMLLGVGTVLTPQQIERIAPIADFAVAPGMNRRVVEAALKANLPFFPGVATASEIEAALEYDIRLLKFFPAEPTGGLPYLKSVNAPYVHLNMKYIPLGGVSQDNLSAYLQNPLIGAVGGSWIASRKLIEADDWAGIGQRAHDAVTVQ